MNDKGTPGIAVQFTDVEILKTRDPVKTSQVQRQVSPAKKRNSDGIETNSYAASAAWTDVQTRCKTGVENKKGDLGATVTNKRAK